MSVLERGVAADESGYAQVLAESIGRRRPWLRGEENVPARRRKLWEIGTAHHCAVIGTCLSMAELRRLARHAGMDDCDIATDYELHHAAVHHAADRNALSTLAHKELERKFAHAVRRSAGLKSDEEIRRFWQEVVASGETAGALWAVVTHPAISDATLDRISGELHMLSHQTGAVSRADLQRLGALEKDKHELQLQLRRQQARTAAELEQKNATIAVLEQRAAQVAAVERRLEEANARIGMLESGEPARLRDRLAAETVRLERAEGRVAALVQLEAQCLQLQAQLSESRRECEVLERALRQLLGRSACPPARIGECAADLAGRCVLYVGGRTGLVDHYRLLVERCRGRFVHHDGGLEDSVKRLQPLLAAADCVVCASGNVSHGAYYVVKRYCKQDRKPCVLLKSASLAAFATGIRALADGASPREGDTVLVADRTAPVRCAGT